MTLPPRTLTDRERTGIELLTARGATPMRIAHALHVEPAQVYRHLTTVAEQWPLDHLARWQNLEPNEPPLSDLSRDQQRDLARREALAYYGVTLSTGRSADLSTAALGLSADQCHRDHVSSASTVSSTGVHSAPVRTVA